MGRRARPGKPSLQQCCPENLLEPHVHSTPTDSIIGATCHMPTRSARSDSCDREAGVVSNLNQPNRGWPHRDKDDPTRLLAEACGLCSALHEVSVGLWPQGRVRRRPSGFIEPVWDWCCSFHDRSGDSPVRPPGLFLEVLSDLPLPRWPGVCSDFVLRSVFLRTCGPSSGEPVPACSVI